MVSILEQRNILLSKIMCKVTSNHAGTAPNRKEEIKEVLCSWARREHRNQQNTHEHTPKKSWKLFDLSTFLVKRSLSCKQKPILSYLMSSVFRETGSCTFFISKRNSRDTRASTINLSQEHKTLNFDCSPLTKRITVWVALLLSSKTVEIKHSPRKCAVWATWKQNSALASESIRNPKTTFKYISIWQFSINYSKWKKKPQTHVGVIKFEFSHELKKTCRSLELENKQKTPTFISRPAEVECSSVGCLVPAGCQACGHLYFVCLQGWRLYHLCVQPVPVLDQTHRGKFIFVSKWNCIVKIGLI